MRDIQLSQVFIPGSKTPPIDEYRIIVVSDIDPDADIASLKPAVDWYDSLIMPTPMRRLAVQPDCPLSAADGEGEKEVIVLFVVRVLTAALAKIKK